MLLKKKKLFNLGPHPHVFSLTLLLSIPLCERATTPLWISFTAAPFWRTLIAANPLVPPQLLCFNQIPCNPSISVLWNPPATVGIFTGLQVLMRKKTRLRHWIVLRRRGACLRGLHKRGRRIGSENVWHLMGPVRGCGRFGCQLREERSNGLRYKKGIRLN